MNGLSNKIREENVNGLSNKTREENMNGISNFWSKSNQHAIEESRVQLLKNIKKALIENNGEVTYYKGWVMINNQAYNGIDKSDISKLQEEIDNEK